MGAESGCVSAGELKHACSGIRRLLSLLEGIPSEATLNFYLKALFGLAERLRIAEGILSIPSGEISARDLRAFLALQEGLVPRRPRSSGETPVNLVEFLALLDTLLRRLPYPVRVAGQGGCLAIDPLEKRHHTSAVTILCGCLGEFFTGDLYRQEVLNDEVREAFNRALKREALRSSTLRRAEEDLIFEQIAMRTTGRLILTYPALDDQSREVIPSRNVDRLRDEGLASTVRIPPRGMAPTASDIFDWKGLIGYLAPFELAGRSREIPSDLDVGRDGLRKTLADCARRVRIERARERGTAGGWDGRVIDEDVRQGLRDRFAGGCVYSPSLLQG